VRHASGQCASLSGVKCEALHESRRTAVAERSERSAARTPGSERLVSARGDEPHSRHSTARSARRAQRRVAVTGLSPPCGRGCRPRWPRRATCAAALTLHSGRHSSNPLNLQALQGQVERFDPRRSPQASPMKSRTSTGWGLLLGFVVPPGEVRRRPAAEKSANDRSDSSSLRAWEYTRRAQVAITLGAIAYCQLALCRVSRAGLRLSPRLACARSGSRQRAITRRRVNTSPRANWAEMAGERKPVSALRFRDQRERESEGERRMEFSILHRATNEPWASRGQEFRPSAPPKCLILLEARLKLCGFESRPPRHFH
jgi:hypothetical protein